MSASRSGVPPLDLAHAKAREDDARADGIADQLSVGSLAPGEEERAVAAGAAPETPFVVLVAVAAGVAALVAVALLAVIVALWAT